MCNRMVAESARVGEKRLEHLLDDRGHIDEVEGDLVAHQRAPSVLINSRRSRSPMCSRSRVLSHSSQSSSNRAGRPSSRGGCTCPSATRTRCIWRVLARKFSALPQLGHVSAETTNTYLGWAHRALTITSLQDDYAAALEAVLQKEELDG